MPAISSRAPDTRPPGTGRSPSQPVLATLSVLVHVFIIVVLISPTLYFEEWAYEGDTAAAHEIRAPFTVRVVDEERREALEEEARETVPRVYVMDASAASRAIDRVDQALQTVDEIIPEDMPLSSPEINTPGAGEHLEALDRAIQRRLGIDLTRATLVTLARNQRDEQFHEELRRALRHLLSERGIEASDRAQMLMDLLKEDRAVIDFEGGARPFEFDGSRILNRNEAATGGVDEYLASHSLLGADERDERSALREIAGALVTANIRADVDETARRVAQAIASVDESAYVTTYRRGDLVAGSRERLGRQQVLALREIERQKPYYLVFNFIGNAALVVALLVFLIIYLRRFRTDWAFNTANVNVIGLPLVLTLALGRVFLLLLPNEPIAGYLFPAAALGMLGVILVGPRVGLLMMFSGCCLFGFMTQMNFQFTMAGVTGGSAAVCSLLTIRRRRDILRAGLIAGLANAAAILVLRFVDNPALLFFTNRTILHQMGWGLGNGLACAMITLMALVVFESIFRVATDLSLIELTSLKTPLMRELEEKTPGTYQHTLNVSKLAESAAEAIGANYLLVRAGAHYHDIGKMVKPKYFTENQATAEERRIHQKLAPSLSALIIKEHVKKGIELARAHRLPERLIDFIPQHHGTSLIRYFHTEAQRRFAMGDTADPVREEEFRYPGPKPQYVETAILMLADAVEATATAKLTGTTVRRDDVERLVRDTIREKFNDGQLDECNLTMSDLNRIRESFVKTLLARYHQRIDYPESQPLAVRA